MKSIRWLISRANDDSQLNTIPDGGSEWWKVNGSDLFALIKTLGVVTVHDSAGQPDRSDIKKQLSAWLRCAPTAGTC